MLNLGSVPVASLNRFMVIGRNEGRASKVMQRNRKDVPPMNATCSIGTPSFGARRMMYTIFRIRNKCAAASEKSGRTKSEDVDEVWFNLRTCRRQAKLLSGTRCSGPTSCSVSRVSRATATRTGSHHPSFLSCLAAYLLAFAFF